jgi:8-oxo-dGTP pyrophosphatase MutT (NUDIX family)
LPPFDLELIRRALRPTEPLRPGNDGKFAAVAAVLRPGADGAEVLLIRRAEHERDPWSGHMAFPGGRFDPEDSDLLQTALRETREEVGLDLSTRATLLGPLDVLPAIARGRRVGMTIAPYVFALERESSLSPNHEVVETLWAPLSWLTKSEHAATVNYQMDGQTLELPAWNVRGRIVWGLTYRMLQALLERVRSAA